MFDIDLLQIYEIDDSICDIISIKFIIFKTYKNLLSNLHF